MSEASDSELLELEEGVSEAAEETDVEVTVASEATAELSEHTADFDEATTDKSEHVTDKSEATANESVASVDITEVTAEESEKHTEITEEIEEAEEELEEEENEEPVESLLVPEGLAEMEEEQYVDVRKLPLRPPQPQLPPEKPVRRPWHPVMWDSSIIGVPPPAPSDGEEFHEAGSEYPHKQRIRNLRQAIKSGKVKPTPEMVIFFLCNKFAVSEERQSKVRS